MKMKEGMEVKVYTFLSEHYTDISGQLQTLTSVSLESHPVHIRLHAEWDLVGKKKDVSS
jgi:hypothetical protein